jgi:uncharacterized membrane protein YbhN (UPF0104 family)
MNPLTAEDTKHARRTWYRIVWNIAGQLVTGAALCLLVVRLIGNSSQVIPDLRQMALVPSMGALLLTLVTLLLMSLGWTCALRAVGVSIAFRSGFAIYYRVSILRYLPGSLWNFPGRAYLCQQRGIALSTFAKSAFLELYFLLTIAGAFAGWGVSLYVENPAILWLSSVVAGTMLFAVIWLLPRFSAALKSILGVGSGEIGRLRRHLVAMVMIYTAVWIAGGAAMVLLLIALPGTPPFNPLHVIPITTAAWLGGFLSPSPAGMGVREFGFSLMLGAGLETAAVVASLTQRVMGFALEGLLWMVARVAYG